MIRQRGRGRARGPSCCCLVEAVIPMMDERCWMMLSFFREKPSMLRKYANLLSRSITSELHHPSRRP